MRQKEHEILMVIRICGISGSGVSHNKLAEEVILDPKNLRHYMKSLIKNGLVKKGKGLQGKYLPTQEFYKDPLLNAYLFADSFKRLLKMKSDLVLTNELRTVVHSKEQPKVIEGKKIDTELFTFNFTKYKKFYFPKFTQKNKIEQNL
jgi:predicted transcriptional regulator